MLRHLYAFFRILRTSFHCWMDDNVSRIAAALSYYIIFSLVPILIICIAIAGFFLKENMMQIYIMDQLRAFVGEDAAAQLRDMLNNRHFLAHDFLPTVFQMSALAFGAIGFFMELQKGFDTIWKPSKKKNKNIWYKIRVNLFPFLMILFISVLFLASLLLNTFITFFGNYLNSFLPEALFILVLNNAISLLLLNCFLTFLFKYLPHPSILWRDAFYAAFITSLFLIIGKLFLEIYISKMNLKATFGGLSSFIVILIWVYYSSQILFFGAEILKVKTKLSYKTKKA